MGILRGRNLRAAFALSLALYFSAELRAQNPEHYIVQLQDEPVASHLARQGAVGQARIRLDDASATAYRAQLATKQAALKQAIEALPQARVNGQLDTVFNGLIVSLRPGDVSAVQQLPGVAHVFPSIQYRKVLNAALPLVDMPQAWATPAIGGEGNAGAGVKIAIIDTGIDLNNPMFQDPSLIPPSGFPKFTAPTPQCNNSDQRFTNSKIIVARNYVALLDNRDPNCDAEDRDGHGTFNGGIAAGHRVAAPLASIAGAAPKAFLGSYKVFGTPGVNDSASTGALLVAIEDAVNDGMDIINLSLGADGNVLPGLDPLDIAVNSATLAGATVAAAAGNEGPGTGTITSPGTSPAVITVGATTNSRILANPLLITANVAVPASLKTIGALPGTAPRQTSNVGAAPLVDVLAVDGDGLACSTLPAGSLSRAIVVIQRGICTFAVKIQNAVNAGAIAAIVFNDQPGQPPVTMDVGGSNQIPSAMISNADGLVLVQFLASPGVAVQGTLQAQQVAISETPNVVASFSANGPSTDLSLKPDLVAPGANIYSAAQQNYPAGVQYDPSGFTLFSGTSFSTPMVAGAAALVKQANPGWSPAQIKSAIVNTAASVATLPQGGTADVLAQGNGLMNVSAALSAPLTVSPVSVSFSAPSGGSSLAQFLTGPPAPFSIFSSNITVRNQSQNPDSFTANVSPATSNGAAVTVSPSTFALGPGASTVLSISASLPGPVETIEGRISIQSQNSQTTVTVPYWGSFAYPSVNSGGVVNAASFTAGPASLAPGAIVSIFGSNLSNTTESALTLPLPASLGGAKVTIGGYAAPLLYASPGQINAQIPNEVEGSSTANVVVSLNGSSSAPMTISLAPAAPGVFTASGDGKGRGDIVHGASGLAVTPAQPAQPGESLELFATGLGAVNPSVATGNQATSSPVSTSNITPTVSIAGVNAPVSFSGLAPGFVGLYQLNFQLPKGIPAGDQTLLLTANGVQSNAVTVSVGQ